VVIPKVPGIPAVLDGYSAIPQNWSIIRVNRNDFPFKNLSAAWPPPNFFMNLRFHQSISTDGYDSICDMIRIPELRNIEIESSVRVDHRLFILQFKVRKSSHANAHRKRSASTAAAANTALLCRITLPQISLEAVDCQLTFPIQ
jgi:hypothetical protein